MITPKQLRTAIILCKRAPLTGEEARDTADTLDALEDTFNMMTQPAPAPEEVTDGDDTHLSK